MASTAADIMQSDFPYVDCDVTVAEAEECFAQDDLVALPVLNPDRTVFGVLTPLNLVQFYRRPLNNPRATHAWEVCDARPVTAHETTALADIASFLVDSSRSHALIVNDEGQLLGMISACQLLGENLPVETSDESMTAAARAQSGENGSR